MSVGGGSTVFSFEEHAPDHVRINTVRFMKTKISIVSVYIDILEGAHISVFLERISFS